jgi:hypothetical protein
VIWLFAKHSSGSPSRLHANPYLQSPVPRPHYWFYFW